MIRTYREEYNKRFSEALYKEFLERLNDGYPDIPFRVAETPVFIPDDLADQLIEAGEEIIRLIRTKDFKALTDRAIPKHWAVPGEDEHPHFLTFDFGICRDDDGRLVPRLIEMQGFPSLYGFQSHLAKHFIDTFKIGEFAQLTPYFNGLDEAAYIELLRSVVVGDHEPHEVALMDVDALNQKTAIDFHITANYLGIKILALSDIFKEGKALHYMENGQKVRLKRIYNRLIFDELEAEAKPVADQARNNFDFGSGFDPREELDIEWVTHPNWFYRISKYTMPFLNTAFVPETHFLDKMAAWPEDLENYVLKPLFSFAGMGVIIDVSLSDLTGIKDPENWILQRKVVYDPVVQAPDGGVKAEIRMMYLWPDGGEPQLCINLARLSRGKMIGVRYNQDFDWVGGTIGLMNQGTNNGN
jgi:hypothetical protein